MKRIIILAAALFIHVDMIYGQSLAVTGSAIIANPDPCLQATAHLTVKNTSLDTLNILCEKIIIDTTAGTSNFFCWGANCYGSETYISSSYNTLDPGEGDNVDFGGYYDAYCDLATATIEYCFYPDTDPNDRTCITILYNGNISSIYESNHVFSNQFFPNPSKEYTNFIYKEGINKSLDFIDILGNKVKSIKLNGTGREQIYIGDLSKGVYFGYTIENNKIIKTKKLIIQ